MTTPGGDQTPIEQVFDLGRHLVLPLTAVALGLIGAYSILMRSSIIETRSEDYITTARAKGLSDDRILQLARVPQRAAADGHADRDQPRLRRGRARSPPRSCSTGRASGTLTVQALDARDYPLLQAIFLLIAVSVVFANFIADIVYGYLDPRVRA